MKCHKRKCSFKEFKASTHFSIYRRYTLYGYAKTLDLFVDNITSAQAKYSQNAEYQANERANNRERIS